MTSAIDHYEPAFLVHGIEWCVNVLEKYTHLMRYAGILPTFHFMITDGMRRLIDENSFYWLLTMAGLYLFGALLYATRTPERFFRMINSFDWVINFFSAGKCDLLFQSHQLFHLCVVCAAFAHYYGISNVSSS